MFSPSIYKKERSKTMKKIFVITSILLVSACTVMKAPTNAVRCHNDGECKSGEYCGFCGVDTAPICRPYHPAITWMCPR